MTIKGLNQLLAELESHCPKQAIVTFLGSDGQPFVINLYRQGKQVKYGEEPYSQELFLRQIQIQCNPVASIILRSFTALDRSDDPTAH